jgi:hypothetical protein
MGVRTRGLDMKAGFTRDATDKAARAEAEAVVQRWNDQLALGRDMLWSHTIRAALIAETPWLDVFCPGCGTSRAIDLRKVDRHPLASVATLVLGQTKSTPSSMLNGLRDTMCNQAGKGDPVAIRRQLPVDSLAADLRARAEILAISGKPDCGAHPVQVQYADPFQALLFPGRAL